MIIFLYWASILVGCACFVVGLAMLADRYSVISPIMMIIGVVLISIAVYGVR